MEIKIKIVNIGDIDGELGFGKMNFREVELDKDKGMMEGDL